MKTNQIILLFLFLGINYSIISQQNSNKFPDSWLGTYHGNMFIIGRNIIDTVDVKFEFLKTQKSNCWTYRMTYNSKKYKDIVKDYELIKPDSLAENTYLMDEKDGILIEEVLIQNTLYSCFTFAGYRLFTFLRKEGENLFFEVVNTKDKSSLTTKNKADEPDQVFEVKSYPPFTTQFVRFKKE